MAFIEPLNLETWIINVFSGDIGIFTAVALFTIFGMAGLFRMTGLSLMMLVGVFFIMFQNYVSQDIYILLISIAGLLIGFWISQLIKR